jgi:hypothetical protein
LLPITIALAALIGCPPDGGSSSTGDIGGGDGGVSCPNGPMAMLNVIISAQSGPVPPDTRVLVSWSAADEPPFELDDPKTWGTLDGNVVCDVDPKKPPPTDLAQLVCHLWTVGVTHVRVRATGYMPFEGMLKPKYSAACKGPVPTDVNVTLAPVPDAGTGGAAN